MTHPAMPEPQEENTMKIEIKSWVTGGVLFAVEAASLRVAVEIAVSRGANLRGANLGGANLRDATNVEHIRLETGETLEEYRRDVVPALLTAGGKTLAEVLDSGCWDCHEWSTCPMAVAFGIDKPESAPPLLRPRVEQFVRLFDARLLPKPTLA